MIDLKEQRSKLLAEVKAVIEGAKKEDRNLTADETAKVDAMYADFDKLGEKLKTDDRAARLASAESELRQFNRPVAPAVLSRPEEDRNTTRNWAMSEDRALSTSASAGGYTIPVGFTAELEKALLHYFPVGTVAATFNTAEGNDFHWPTVTDVANSASIVTEASGIGSSSDPTFGEVIFKSWDYYSPIVKLSNQVIRDSAINFDALLADLFAERMARALQAACVSTNAGSSAPEGMLYGVTAGVNLATGNPITPAKLVALETSVPLAYRDQPGFGFMMHDDTWQAVRQLVDTTGRFLVNAGLQDGVEKRLLGKPVHICNAMTSIASPGDNLPLILAGDLKRYKIRYVGTPNLTKLVELYAANGQIGLVLHQAWDARWITKAGVRTLNSFDSE